jgi:hypothetical protein
MLMILQAQNTRVCQKRWNPYVDLPVLKIGLKPKEKILCQNAHAIANPANMAIAQVALARTANAKIALATKFGAIKAQVAYRW